MKHLRTVGILPKVLDPDLPPECQYEAEWEIFEAHQCNNCGEIYEESPDRCKVCGHGYFTAVEVTEDLKEVPDC